MVVIAGVPEAVDDHADRIVEMGLAMVHVTRTIYSPADGKHIEVADKQSWSLFAVTIFVFLIR